MTLKKRLYRELQDEMIEDMLKSKQILEQHNKTPSFVEGVLFSYAKVLLHLENEIYNLEEAKND